MNDVSHEPIPARRIRTADLLAVGSELTTGETRDTNGGELARSHSTLGVAVRRILALPDDLDLVAGAFRESLSSVDLVVATGGLGPTPDDLTREAVAAAVGETPAVDPDLEAWMRALYARRGMRMPRVNLKQTWMIPSAVSIPNENGTAPGWWVDRPDGRIAVLLPGPPREMRPMWSDWVVPRLRERGLGDGRVVRTLRTYGIGESVVAEMLGERLLRGTNPVVATYARADWLDVRVSAVAELDADGRVAQTADALLDATAERVGRTLGAYVWAEGETTWADLVSDAASRAGVRLAIAEAGTRGALGELLAEVPALLRATAYGTEVPPEPLAPRLEEMASDVARDAGAEVGAALAAWPADPGTNLRAAIAMPGGGSPRVLELRIFQHGAHGRFRAGVAAAAFIVECLRDVGTQAVSGR